MAKKQSNKKSIQQEMPISDTTKEVEVEPDELFDGLESTAD